MAAAAVLAMVVLLFLTPFTVLVTWIFHVFSFSIQKERWVGNSYSSEFNSAVDCSVKVVFSCVWEFFEQLKEPLFLQTHACGMLSLSCFIKNLRSETHYYLVASKVGISGKHKEFTLAFRNDRFFREYDCALVDQIEFLELFSFSHYFTPRQKDATVKGWQKVWSKFLSRFKFLFIFEHINEVLFEVAK